jgi:hypothetical protein
MGKNPCKLQLFLPFKLPHTKACCVLVVSRKAGRANIPSANDSAHRQNVEIIPYTKRPSAPVSARAASSGSCRDSNRGVGDPSTNRTKKSKEAIFVFIFSQMLISLTLADGAVRHGAVERLRCYTSDQGYVHPFVKTYQPFGTCGVDPGETHGLCSRSPHGTETWPGRERCGTLGGRFVINTTQRSESSKLD